MEPNQSLPGVLDIDSYYHPAFNNLTCSGLPYTYYSPGSSTSFAYTVFLDPETDTIMYSDPTNPTVYSQFSFLQDGVCQPRSVEVTLIRVYPNNVTVTGIDPILCGAGCARIENVTFELTLPPQ